jgi:uncharacterized protein DUF2637
MRLRPRWLRKHPKSAARPQPVAQVRGDGLVRFSAGLSLTALATITGVVSYLHALSVVHMTGSAGVVIPFVADFMILTASLALLDAIRHHARKPRLAMVSLTVGIGSTVAFNVVAGLVHGAGGALVASLPPVAFVLSLETLMGIVRLARGGEPETTADQTDPCPHGVAQTLDEAVVMAWEHRRVCLGEKTSQRPFADGFGISQRPRPRPRTQPHKPPAAGLAS